MLVSGLGLLKAIHFSVEAEVGLAVVLMGQAVKSQRPAASCDHQHPRRQEEDRPPQVALPGLDRVGVLPGKRS